MSTGLLKQWPKKIVRMREGRERERERGREGEGEIERGERDIGRG